MTPTEELLYLKELGDEAFKLFWKTKNPVKAAGPQIAQAYYDYISERIHALSSWDNEMCIEEAAALGDVPH